MGYPPAPARGPQSLLSRGGREHCQHQRNDLRVASSSQRRERRGVGSPQNVGAAGSMAVQCITLKLTIVWCKGTPHSLTIFWHKAMPNNFACSLIILYHFCHAILYLHASPLIIAISGQESAPCHFAAQCYDLFPPQHCHKPQGNTPRQHVTMLLCKATFLFVSLPFYCVSYYFTHNIVIFLCKVQRNNISPNRIPQHHYNCIIGHKVEPSVPLAVVSHW